MSRISEIIHIRNRRNGRIINSYVIFQEIGGICVVVHNGTTTQMQASEVEELREQARSVDAHIAEHGIRPWKPEDLEQD